MLPQNGVPEDLKNLLAKWNLECILSHLVGEKIDIKVLEMMKLQHIRLLLQYFPMGIQIRFEYYLEQWREEIGKPFQLYVNDNRSLLIAKENDYTNKTPAKEMETKATQTDLIIYNVSSIPLNNNESITNDASASNSCGDQLSSTLKSPRPTQSQQVDLLTILKNASCGIGLLNSYGLRQSFTNQERKVLIETIADYFVKNNIQFNVQISHALEQDILKMFPSEKLNSYRIDKCGKIFITYIKAKAKARAESKAADVKLEAATAKAEAKAAAKAEAIAAAEAEANAEPKVVKVGNTVYEISSNMIVDEDFEALYQLSDNHIMIRADNNTNSAMTDVSQIDSMSDNTESMIFTLDHPSDDEKYRTALKINADEVDIAATLDSETLIRKMLSQKRQRIEEIDRPFIDFTIPWEKLPSDIMCSLQMEQPLGKRLNLFANLVVDELRKIAKHVPMRVLRAVNQQAVMKYPHSFLDKDSKGNLKTSTTTALLSRLRNRHTFLNRHDR